MRASPRWPFVVLSVLLGLALVSCGHFAGELPNSSAGPQANCVCPAFAVSDRRSCDGRARLEPPIADRKSGARSARGNPLLELQLQSLAECRALGDE